MVSGCVCGEAAIYEQLATEYYEVFRHPTCALFRLASARIVGAWLAVGNSPSSPSAAIWEVGAGRSIVAELLAARGGTLRFLTLTDGSAAMLTHSASYREGGASTIVAAADHLPVGDGGIDALVASLGDPYNTDAFWSEVRRSLRPGGGAIFTTPSYEWAYSYRTSKGEPLGSARFSLADGRVVDVPSHILAQADQIALIREHDLEVEAVATVTLAELGDAALSAPKVLPVRPADTGVLTGYRVVKPQRSG